jgi:branched-chain amino acid transport system permease protein
MLNVIGINIIAAVGLNVVKGYAGQVNVGHHGLYGIGAYSTALLTLRAGFPSWMSLATAVAMSAFVGVLLGIPAFKLEGAYLALVTLAFGESVRIIANNWDWVGSSIGLPGVPHLAIGRLRLDTPLRFYYAVLAIVGASTWVSWNLVRSATGRAFQALRDDSLAASVIGVDLRRYKLIAFTFGSAYAGLAGALHAHLTGFVHPENYNFRLMVMFMLMVILGGLGSLTGSILGAVIVTLVFDWTRSYREYQMVVFGTAMLLTVRYLPRGIVGLSIPAILNRSLQRPSGSSN